MVVGGYQRAAILASRRGGRCSRQRLTSQIWIMTASVRLPKSKPHRVSPSLVLRTDNLRVAKYKLHQQCQRRSHRQCDMDDQRGGWTTSSLSGAQRRRRFSLERRHIHHRCRVWRDGNNNPSALPQPLRSARLRLRFLSSARPTRSRMEVRTQSAPFPRTISGTVTGTVSLTYNGTAWTTVSLSSGSGTATWSSTSGIGTYTMARRTRRQQ